MTQVSVKELLEDKEYDLQLQAVAGESGLENTIRIPYVQKPGIAMTGYMSFLVRHRIQVFGKTEIMYILQLDEDSQDRIFMEYFGKDLACCIVTRSLMPSPLFLRHAERTNTPVLSTPLPTQPFIERITRFLEFRFAQTTSVHGVLMDVFEIGILILGKSGIGKSECALDLVLRGHRLVADDLVELLRLTHSVIVGRGTDIIKYHMEIRGLGIINIKELFGISAVRDRKRINLVVQLIDWSESKDYDRVGLREDKYSILGVDLPMIIIPVRSGRNLTTIIEVAARNHLLKTEGYFAAKELQKRIIDRNTNAGIEGLKSEKETE